MRTSIVVPDERRKVEWAAAGGDRPQLSSLSFTTLVGSLTQCRPNRNDESRDSSLIFRVLYPTLLGEEEDI